MDSLLLSRLQFAFTAGFHIIWPTISIGLCLLLVILEGLWLKTKDISYLNIYRFLVKIFALAFGIGVASGIPLALEFGTNWSKFSQFAAPIMGPIFATEIITAFFLEAVFVGVMLFGWKKVSPKFHFFSTVMVFLGTHNSAVWIIIFNSWMQTPAGFELMDGGIIQIKSFADIIFTPSVPYRLAHMLTAAYLTGAVFTAGLAGYLVMKKISLDIAKKMLAFCGTVIIVLAPLQVVIGDQHGLNTLEYQPQKIAAIEAIWEDESPASLKVFAIPDVKNEKNNNEIAIPKLGSLILTHHLDGAVKGLKSFPKDERPSSVGTIFWSFRVMAGCGFAMCALAILFLISKFKKSILENKLFNIFCFLCTPLGIVAVISGWCVTELGRQPWIVTGVVKISHGVSDLSKANVSLTLSIFCVIYLLFLMLFCAFLIKHVKKGVVIQTKEEIYS